MHIDVHPEGYLSLEGRLDSSSADKVRNVLTAALDALTQVQEDLYIRADRLQIWDAAGLKVLVGVHRLAERRDRRVVLVDPSMNVQHLLHRVGLHRDLLDPRACVPGQRSS